MVRFLGVFLFLSGCAEVVDLTSFVIFETPQAHSVIKQKFDPTLPSQVIITTESYKGDYDIIGEVSIDSGKIGVNNDDLARQLQSEASKYGANMVINTKFDHSFILQVHSAKGLAISAKIVK